MMIFDGYGPYLWRPGTLPDVNRANDNWGYLAQACQDVFDRRYAYSVVGFDFFKNSVGLTDQSSLETRRYRISPSQSISIVGLFLTGSLSGANQQAQISLIDISTGEAPAGLRDPIFTLDGCSEDTQTFSQEIPLTAGSTYALQISGDDFETDNVVVTCHFRSDRFNTAGTDTRQVPEIIYYTEADQNSADNWNANDTAIAAAVTANVAKVSAQKPSLFVLQDFADGYDSDFTRWELPRLDSSRFRSRIVRIQAFAEFAEAGGSSDTVTWTLQDESGASTGLAAVCSMNGVTFATGADTSPAVELSTATTGVESLPANDYRLVVVNNSSTVCLKSYCWLWVE